MCALVPPPTYCMEVWRSSHNYLPVHDDHRPLRAAVMMTTDFYTIIVLIIKLVFVENIAEL